MTKHVLLSSPGNEYLDEITTAIETAHSVTLITAFVTSSGIASISAALRRQLTRPTSQARLIVAVDRSGFNTLEAFQSLLKLQQEFSQRMELGLVHWSAGFLHAKALLTENAEGSHLLIGSANLTRSAFSRNYEAGILIRDVDPLLLSEFNRFLNGIEYRTICDEAQLRHAIGSPPAIAGALDQPGTLTELLKTYRVDAPLPPIPADPASFLSGWADRGYLIGRGRPATEALVIRLPMQGLVHKGMIRTSGRVRLGQGAHEQRALGYSVPLVPSEFAEQVRRQVRRISALPSRLGLNLPCFGFWMPESFWGVFQQARQALLGNNTFSRERLREQAIVQRQYLESDSGLGETLNLIIDRLSLAASLLPEREPEVRLFLANHVREALTRRTPEMVADAVEFRIGRQRWQPFDQSSEPYRQLTADVMHATFHSFYRTGTWPRHSRSHVARLLATHIAQKVGNFEDALALQLLDVARSWEHPAVPLGVVAQEFRFLVADDIHFDPPALSEILRETEETEDTRLEEEDDEF